MSPTTCILSRTVSTTERKYSPSSSSGRRGWCETIAAESRTDEGAIPAGKSSTTFEKEDDVGVDDGVDGVDVGVLVVAVGGVDGGVGSDLKK